jgi:hypothetical protein
MKRFLILALALFFGPPPSRAADTSKLDAEGQALVKDLLSRRPPAITNTGQLKLRLPKNKRAELRVEQRILPGDGGWQDIYSATTTNGQKISVLTITHSDHQPNRYRLQLFKDGTADAGKDLTGEAAMVPFAGTDFWPTDLGLEFLHWPTQRVLKKELRRGESCYVLESMAAPTTTAGYVRVVSWIDIDTGGIVHAEAYDAQQKLLKEFDPKDFQKIQGQYQLKSMEIRNDQADTRTLIVFDLDVK